MAVKAKQLTHNIKFQKLQGTGNDFIFVSNLNSVQIPEGTELRSRIARALCDRHFGIGADGLVIVSSSKRKKDALKWDFYNQDGSQAEFCGNAARCFGRWVLKNLLRPKFLFESKLGFIKLCHKRDPINLKDQFVVCFENLNSDFKQLKVESQFKNLIGSSILVNTGVPHIVCIQKRKLEKDEEYSISKHYRFHSESGKAGANVTFLFENECKTFERGVEDFTLSCGTGVLAAAHINWFFTKQMQSKLKTPGGELVVDIVSIKSDRIVAAELIGAAEFVFAGQLKIGSKNLEK